MRGLSLTQPWATLVAIGAKKVETRGWRNAYRGDIAIHAAKAFPSEEREACWEPAFRAALERTGLIDYAPYSDLDTTDVERFSLPLGAIVAVVRLVDIVPTEQHVQVISRDEQDFGDYAPGRYAWLLDDVRMLPDPWPCRGMQGLWPVPLAFAEAFRAVAR